MSRCGLAIVLLVALVAIYFGGYAYLVKTHTTRMYCAVDMGATIVPPGDCWIERFYYSSNPNLDAACELIFRPLHLVAHQFDWHNAEYRSCKDQWSEFKFFLSVGR
jgi:hypothetical protein